MKSQAEIELLRDQLEALIRLGDPGPFHPDMRYAVLVVWNCLCYVLEDGSPFAEIFADNVTAVEQWCREHGLEIHKAPRVH